MSHTIKRDLFGLLLAVGLFAVSMGAQAGLKEGRSAYKSKDFETAMNEFKPLADNGDPVAQFYIGLMYDNGEGVLQSYPQAIVWYTKSADKGFAPAQSNLGVIYESGGLVERDFKKAASYYQKAAEQGDTAAQFNLGLMYYVGRGADFPRNTAQAAIWYGKAAELGSAVAQNAYGQLCENGYGVKLSYIAAYKWYSLAAEGGSDPAKTNMETLAARMTPEQIADAKAQAQEWKKHK